MRVWAGPALLPEAIKDIISSSTFIMIEDFTLKRGYMGAITLLIFMLSEEPNFGRVLPRAFPVTCPQPLPCRLRPPATGLQTRGFFMGGFRFFLKKSSSLFPELGQN
jgi:hypothetical protein